MSFCAFYERINWLIDWLIEVCNYVPVWSWCYAMAHLCLLCKLFADLINSAKNPACYLFLQATITHSRLISTYQELTKHCGPLAPTDRSYRSWQQVVVADHWCCATAIRVRLYSFRFSLHPVVIWMRIELSSDDNTSTSFSQRLLWPTYVIGQAIIFLPCGFYLLLSSICFPRLISAAADWMSTILPHTVWP